MSSLTELHGSLESSVAQLQQNLKQRDVDGSKMTLQVQVSGRHSLVLTKLLTVLIFKLYYTSASADMDDDADAKMILTAPPPENCKGPPGRPCITWLNTIQRDLRVYNLTLKEAVDLVQNRPLWRLMSMYGATHY